MSDHETVLTAPPGDGISCLHFSPCSNSLLLVSSWDETARLYDVSQNMSKATFNFKASSLSCCLCNDEKGYAAGLDRNIHNLDLIRGTQSIIGSHEKAVSCLEYNSTNNILFSGSWDTYISSWDARMQNEITKICTANKVYSISSNNYKLVVVTANRAVLIYDIRNMNQCEQERESSLRYQSRKVACFPDNTGYAMGSIEGRVAIEYFDLTPEVQSRKYAFKCHRKGDIAYPVNALAYHPIYGTFATGGCDGLVNIWDGRNKKRLCQLHPYPTSISSLAFSHDGSILAISSSYTYESGDIPHPEDNIYLRYIQEVDVKPRPKE